MALGKFSLFIEREVGSNLLVDTKCSVSVGISQIRAHANARIWEIISSVLAYIKVYLVLVATGTHEKHKSTEARAVSNRKSPVPIIRIYEGLCDLRRTFPCAWSL